MNVRTAVTTVAAESGYANRSAEIDRVVSVIEGGASQYEVSALLATYVPSSTARDLANRVFANINAGATTTVDTGVVESFDRATAASVIRAFIQDGEYHVGDRGAPKEDVDALLVLAGLEDEVIPEPEPEAEVSDPSVLQRLVSWARGQGFGG